MKAGKPIELTIARSVALLAKAVLIVGMSGIAALTVLLVTLDRTQHYERLKCAGDVTGADSQPLRSAILFAEIKLHGPIVRLWSNNAGSVTTEIPNDTTDLYWVQKNGSSMFLTGSSGPGSYSTLSRAISVKIRDGEYFDGSCQPAI